MQPLPQLWHRRESPLQSCTYLQQIDGVARGKAIVKMFLRPIKETERLGVTLCISGQEVQRRVIPHLDHRIVKGNEKQTLVRRW